MRSKMFIYNEEIIEFKRVYKDLLIITQNNIYSNYKENIPNIEIECGECGKRAQGSKYKIYHSRHNQYFCQCCWGKGERNPFYGKQHPPETMKAIKSKLIGKMVGEKNPFYGKVHTEETIEKIKLRNQIFRDQMTDEQKASMAKNQSIGQNNFRKANPEYYKKIKSHAGKISHQSANKKFKINKLEQKVLDKLNELDLNFRYSVILDTYQFDFGNKEHRILLEVHGDYWHANPEIFDDDDPNKRNLYDHQYHKIQRDREKIEFCKKHNIKLFIIWESNVNNDDFTVLEEIKNEINKNQEN